MFKFTQKYFNGSAQPNYRDIPCDFKAGHETTFSDSMHDSEVNKMSITDNRESFQSSGSGVPRKENNIQIPMFNQVALNVF